MVLEMELVMNPTLVVGRRLCSLDKFRVHAIPEPRAWDELGR